MSNIKNEETKQDFEDLEKVSSILYDRVWGITKELNENIRHYNEHQAKYRSLASQWLLGAFAAMGFVLISNIELDFDKLWLVAVIASVAALGIFQLWRMDIPVFQSIIAAFFTSGILLESKYHFLPDVKLKILKYVKHHSASQSLFYFYYLIISVFILITASVIIYLTSINKNNGWIITASLIVMAFLLLLHRHMKIRSTRIGEKVVDL
jgi:hypothetical protein